MAETRKSIEKCICYKPELQIIKFKVFTYSEISIRKNSLLLTIWLASSGVIFTGIANIDYNVNNVLLLEITRFMPPM